MQGESRLGGVKVEKRLTIAQASRTFDAHMVTLARLCLMGRLEATKGPDGRWLIKKTSLESWNRQRKRQAPISKKSGVSVVAEDNT